ncbi:MAG: TatD family hydrolase [Alistipes sp.]|nr:TatD family hydrolase [Alistipes sp.]
MRTILVDIHTHHPSEDRLSPQMVGIHPWDADKSLTLPDLRPCDIVGETGLDLCCGVSIERQMELFRWHLEQAEKLEKPVVLHAVRSFEQVIKTLGDYTLKGVVFHGFIGSAHQAGEALRRGYYLSFGERSLRSSRTREAIAITPLDRLFAETDDNPELSIETIYDAIAEIKAISCEELAVNIEKNYKTLIR